MCRTTTGTGSTSGGFFPGVENDEICSRPEPGFPASEMVGVEGPVRLVVVGLSALPVAEKQVVEKMIGRVILSHQPLRGIPNRYLWVAEYNSASMPTILYLLRDARKIIFDFRW